jgi:hypothetical protein
MEQSSSWEADGHLDGQKIPHILYKTENSLLCSQETTTATYPELHKFSLHSDILLLYDTF